MIVELQEDENGDLLLPFPDELLDVLGWEIGDVLNFILQEDGSIIINKKE